MTQMMSRPETLEAQSPVIQLPEQRAMPIQLELGLELQLERRNQVRAAAAFSFKDLVRVEVYRTTSYGHSGLNNDWEHAGTLPGIVVKVHESQSPDDYAGLVPVLTDAPYPTAGHYVSSGPRFLDPVTPQIERIPQGTDWLMYVLQHDRPEINL